MSGVVAAAAAAVNETGMDRARLRQCLANKRIVFVGTSTLRYEYLTLAYFAEYGVWPSDMKQVMYGQNQYGPTPLVEQEVLFSTQLPWAATSPRQPLQGCKRDDLKWESFYRYTNMIFNGHELCDCYRHGNDYGNTTENRIYRSASGDFSLAYFQWWGQFSNPHGQCTPAAYSTGTPGSVASQCRPGEGASFAWAQPAPEFLLSAVKNMRPTHLVMNADWWPVDQLAPSFWQQLAAAGIQAVQPQGGRAFWRSSPAKFGARQPNFVDTTPLTAAGWQGYPAAEIIAEVQPSWPNHAVFSDEYMHLTPAANVHVVHRFLQTLVCP